MSWSLYFIDCVRALYSRVWLNIKYINLYYLLFIFIINLYLLYNQYKIISEINAQKEYYHLPDKHENMQINL